MTTPRLSCQTRRKNLLVHKGLMIYTFASVAITADIFVYGQIRHFRHYFVEISLFYNHIWFVAKQMLIHSVFITCVHLLPWSSLLHTKVSIHCVHFYWAMVIHRCRHFTQILSLFILVVNTCVHVLDVSIIVSYLKWGPLWRTGLFPFVNSYMYIVGLGVKLYKITIYKIFNYICFNMYIWYHIVVTCIADLL